MTIKVEINKEELYPQEIDGHEFRLTTIVRRGDAYDLNGLTLSNDWEENIPKMRQTNVAAFCSNFGSLVGIPNLKGTVFQDKDTGLITDVEIDFSHGHSSRVSLDTSFSTRGGFYRLNNVNDISIAIIYQNFLARYLNHIDGDGTKYAYINRDFTRHVDNHSSPNLIIPKNIFDGKDINISESFHDKAIYITGQFSTELRYIKYTDKGFISTVQIDSNDCVYSLSERSYHPHNVDEYFQAATLHNIVAEYYNDILRIGSSEGWI